MDGWTDGHYYGNRPIKFLEVYKWCAIPLSPSLHHHLPSHVPDVADICWSALLSCAYGIKLRIICFEATKPLVIQRQSNGCLPLSLLQYNIILTIYIIYPGHLYCPWHLSGFGSSGCGQVPVFRRRRTVATSESPLIQSYSGVAVGCYVRWRGENWKRRHFWVD